jgi:hypothetical protein
MSSATAVSAPVRGDEFLVVEHWAISSFVAAPFGHPELAWTFWFGSSSFGPPTCWGGSHGCASILAFSFSTAFRTAFWAAIFAFALCGSICRYGGCLWGFGWLLVGHHGAQLSSIEFYERVH